MRVEPAEPFAAVVLAAGESRRFGSQKLLMPFRGSTILGCTIAALAQAGLDPIIVVAGGDGESIARALQGTPATVVCNPDPARGMLSSVQTGMAALPPGPRHFLIALGDQPGIRSEDILHLLREHRRLGKGITIPTHRGKRGHPVLLHHNYRGEVLALDDRQTLRHLIHAHPDDIAEVEFASDSLVCDIDTREQYEHELRRPLAEL